MGMVGALILYYHSVAPASHPNPLSDINRSLRVDTERFRCQMELLARSFSIVPLETLIAEVKAGSPRRREACVTLDDGYADNHEYAFPILRSLGIPATIFLTTQPIEEGKQFFWERLGWYLAQRLGRKLVLPPDLGARTIQLDSAADAGEVFDYLVGRMRTVNAERREALLDALGVEPSPYTRPLTWGEAASMLTAGITFGAHSHTHTSLPALATDAIREEITASRNIITLRLGKMSSIFAYPNGNVDERTERILATEGFSGAVTILGGLCTAMSPRFRWPRMDPGNRNKAEFTQWLYEVTGVGVNAGTWVKSYLKTALPSRLVATGKRIRGMLRVSY